MGDGFSFSGPAPEAPPGALPRLPQNAGALGGNLRPGCRCKPTAFFLPPGYSGGCPEGGRTLSKLCFVSALNFCINALLLAGTGNLAGKGLRPWRLLLASALGAAYAGVCLRPALRPLAGLPWRLAILGAMALVAYGPDGKTGGVFVLLTMALGYAVNAAGRGGVWQLPVCLVGVQLLGRFALGAQRIIPVEISGDGATVHLRALWDTGNQLRDPVTGESVLVIGSSPARQLTGLTEAQLARPLETLENSPLPGLRLVPYQAVGAKNGLLLAKRFSKVRLGGRSCAALVAFAPQSFGTDYQALAGGILC